MKEGMLLLSFTCLIMMYVTGCKNDQTDNTRADTTLMTAPTLSPFTDSMKHSDSTAKKTDSLTKEKKQRVNDEVRVKKVSKKGKIILQLLKINMQEKIEADAEGIYNHAEVMPMYPSGQKALRDFIENNMHYPQSAIDNDIQGTIKVYFAVDEKGEIYAPAIISPKLGYGLETEALRVIKQMPRWIPGQVNGENVKTHVTLSITYRLIDFVQ